VVVGWRRVILTRRGTGRIASFSMRNTKRKMLDICMAGGQVYIFITAEKGGVARAKGGGEKEKECTIEYKSDGMRTYF